MLINIRKLEGFSYYDTALNDEDIKGICKSGRGNHVNYKYDTLGRTTEKTIDTGIAKVTTKYSFEKGKNSNTTTKVSEIDNNGKKIAYTYDVNGNIETITDGGKKITYTYDELNQLTKEQNEIEEKEISYTYDIGGNIVSKTETTFSGDSKTTTYKYEDSNWKDKLTSFNGKAITYDGIGNPLTYDGWKFQWEQGRKLSKLDGNGYNISYKYNPSGIRTEKEVNGVVTRYHLEDDEVTFEENGKDKIHYTYDLNDNLISMNLNGQEYYYIRNAQNDIIALNNSRGTTVATYTYDSWGKLLSIKDENGTDITNNKDHVGYKNPYRYRGYRYDTETGLYYLNSRYYNSEWGRFVNADSEGGKVGELLSHNVFNYCSNNPIVRTDHSGCAWWIVGAAAGAVVGGVVGGIYSYCKTGRVNWRYVAGGAVVGALAGAGLGYLAEAVYSNMAFSANSFRFTQTTASHKFSKEGKFAGKTIGQVSRHIRKGIIKVKDVPVEYVKRGGKKLIINTRSSLALRRANIPLKKWNLVDRTGIIEYEIKITERLSKNNLHNQGTEFIRITGCFSKNMSCLK
ncbi:RHS repeat-associated core domain-containing protein [Clostridium botulinum]|nr:RHS repeat-associated core domain-containing protein [Clostridium botulinum]NFL04087.1 RHS repeat-associated core domain-containing protein [Clostridium botulinum]